MSEIKVDTLTGKTTAKTVTVTVGASVTQSLEQGLGKAWANYSQTDNTVRDSLNISSVTDSSVGRHAYVFSNNMSNANWAGGYITRNNRHQWNTDEGATTGRDVRVAGSDNGEADCHSNTLICMGDLA
mgnify:CR=1 FL=1